MPLGQVARAAVRSRAVAAAGGPGLSACAFFYPDTVTWPSARQGIVLEVDLETCAISLLKLAAMHDCGRPINPVIVEGQLHGGIAQGLGSALAEALILRRDGPAFSPALSWTIRCRARRTCRRSRSSHLDFPSAINPLRDQGPDGRRAAVPSLPAA
jgi:carbon-monoxide dehydrogenase large subunit